MVQSLKLQGRPWSFSDCTMLTWTEKGGNWMERCTAYICFLMHIPYIGQIEVLTHKGTNRAMNSVNPH